MIHSLGGTNIGSKCGPQSIYWQKKIKNARKQNLFAHFRKTAQRCTKISAKCSNLDPKTDLDQFTVQNFPHITKTFNTSPVFNNLTRLKIEIISPND